MNLQTIQHLSIDFNQKGYKIINANQYDKETRAVVVHCTDNGTYVPLDNTVYANARTMTADGRALLDPATIQGDGTILLELDDTLLAAPGRAATQIDIYQNGTEKRLTTMSFFINVEPSVYGDDTITASDEFNALTELIKKATKDYEYVIDESKKHADNAKVAEDNAANSAADAANSASESSEYAASSQSFAAAAAQEATASENSANAAKISEDNAKVAETNAANSESNAANSAQTAANKASESSAHADMSKSYAIGTNNEVREGDAADNAKKYYEQARDIAESFAGTLRPKGTITFSNLPSATDAKEGDMYNVSDQFTTTASFKEGEGNVIPAGSNVYRTDDGFWDVLAGSPVTGVKGDTEASYRRGNVNITAEDIGLGNVNNTADADKPISTAQQEALDKKVNKAGDKMTGRLMNQGGTSVYLTTEQSGHGDGFIKVARFENLVPNRNHNSPIILELVKRKGLGSVTLFISWQAINETNGVPSLRSFGGNGNYGARMVNVEDDVWDLYVQSQASNDHVEVVRFSKPQYDSNVKVTFYKDQFVTTLPSGTMIGFTDWIGEISSNVASLMDKMAALEAVWPHVLWDTGGWNPFTDTASASAINEEVAQDEN